MIAYKHAVAVLILASCGVSPIFGQTIKPSNEAEKAYLKYVAARKAKDLATLDTVIASDYMTLNGEKKVGHKSDEMEEAKNSPAYDVMQVDEIHSLVVSDTAVISTLLTVAGTSGGKSYKVQVRDLATFLKREGHWQLIADQSAS